MLFVVATPIGNLSDISFRAIEILRQADYIAAEDTRHSGLLLKHYEIKTPQISFHSHSGQAKYDKIINLLQSGANIALITDAGTPGISDPGGMLIKKVIEEGIDVQAIPGPSAFLLALTVSGFDMSKFQFLGFVPHKKGRQTFFRELAEQEITTVFYESSHRIQKTLQAMAENLAPDRKICVARELTKKFEEVIRGNVAEVCAKIMSKAPKGEYVLVVESL